MPRRMELTLAPELTQPLLVELAGAAGVLSLKVDRGASVRPPGDVITLVVSTRRLPELYRMLQDRGVGRDGASLLVTSDTTSVMSVPTASLVQADTNDATWEEIDALMTSEAGANANLAGLMALGGALAALGLATGALHLVIAAMVIAPGFEPIARIGLGVISGTRSWRQGLAASAIGYLSMFLGALAMAWVLPALGHPVVGEGGQLLPSSVLVRFWTTLSATSVLTSAVAAAAGALLVAANRSELTIGAMIGLALIPSLTLIPLELVAGHRGLAQSAAVRWAVDAATVLGASLLVFGWKRLRVHRRGALA